MDKCIIRYNNIFSKWSVHMECVVYNIFNKIEFPDNIDSSILDTYIVSGREPLTTTSYNIYGDIESWWIIYLLNKKAIGNKFYAEGGLQLTYILPNKRCLIYQQITDTTQYNNQHF